jgi:hypothetical protein
VTKTVVMGYGLTSRPVVPGDEGSGGKPSKDKPPKIATFADEPPVDPDAPRVEPGAPAMFVFKPPPDDLQSLIIRNLVIGEDGRPWTDGEYAFLPDSTKCYWDGETWREGVAPSPA